MGSQRVFHLFREIFVAINREFLRKDVFLPNPAEQIVEVFVGLLAWVVSIEQNLEKDLANEQFFERRLQIVGREASGGPVVGAKFEFPTNAGGQSCDASA